MRIADFIEQLFTGKSASAGFQWNADSEGINLFLPRNEFAVLEQGEGDHCTLTQYAHLKMLEEQGLAERLPNGFIIASELAVQLDDDVRRLLELPAPFPGDFRADMHGLTTHADFNVKLLPCLSGATEFNAWSIKGPLLWISEQTRYLLTPAQWLAFNALQAHQNSEGAGDDEQRNLALLAALQRAKKQGMRVELAAFDTIEIVSPEKVSLSIERKDNGGLLLSPHYGDSSIAADIAQRLGQLKPDARVGSLRVGNKRIVLDEARFKATWEIINNRCVAPEQAQAFLRNPADFLDATLIDFDEGFSARVQGVTAFQKYYFGETDATEIDWFGKAEPAPRTVRADELDKLINKQTDLERFQDAYEQALEDGQTTLDFKGARVDFSDRDAIDKALDRIAAKIIDKEASETDPPPKTDPNKPGPPLVVDIQPNDNALEFSAELTAALNGRIEALSYRGQIDWSRYLRSPFSYQEEGIRWLLGLARHTLQLTGEQLGKDGALLADDMGLGKTFMTLVAIAEYLQQGQANNDQARPVLVVAPLGLLDNWEQEVKATYAPAHDPFKEIIKLQADADLRRFRASPQTIPSNTHQEDEQASIQKALKTGRDYGADRLDQPRRLVLTTYETLRDYQFSLCRVDWSLVIFDEAQMVKNPNTLASRAAKGLKARFKLAVTGTPVENSLRDFWNLLDTVRPGHLDAYQPFNREFIRPINRVPREQRANERQQIGLQLRAKTGLVMLRRNKVDKLEGLPAKTIYTGVEDQSPDTRFYAPLQCTMQRGQADVYDMVVANVTAQAADDNAGNPFLAGLQRLRDVALHPALLDGGILPRPQSREQAQRLIHESSKLECVIDLLKTIQEKNEKAIIFAINKRAQEFVAAACEQLFDIRVHIINGDTKAVARRSGALTRRRMIEAFQSEPGFGVIVMSPIAAGVGLTITAANHVIHLERHWNPAKEAQATDRVYRIGQEKDVFVYLPVLRHPDAGSEPEKVTFDQNLNRLLNEKSALKDAVVTPEDVQPDDVMRNVFSKGSPSRPAVDLQARDIDTLGWKNFEAFCAVLLGKVYDTQTQLTAAKDHGCDVVLRGKINALIQCKFSERSDAVYDSEDIVKEICWAQQKYNDALHEEFKKLFAISNARGFSRRVKQSAKSKNVTLIDRPKLIKWLKRHPVTRNEVTQKLSQERMDS